MTKKTAIKIIILLLLVSLGVVSYFVFFQKSETGENGEVNFPEQPNSNFFPESENFSPEFENNNQEPTNQETISVINKQRKISENPVSGYKLIDRITETSSNLSQNGEDETTETETVYIFSNKSNGNIFETSSKNSKVERVTNTTIPKVYESLFSQDEDFVIFRYLDEGNNVESYFSKLTKNNSTTTISGDESNFYTLESSFLPRNIKNIKISSENNVFYTLETSNGLNGFVFNTNNKTNQSLVLESEIKQFNTEWLNENTILLGTKPSLYSDSFLFEYNLSDKKLNKILEANEGFTFIPKINSNKILYSELSGSNMKTFVLNIDTDTKQEVRTNTIAGDKCVWSQLEENIIYCAEPTIPIGVGYPNSWYKGLISFNDKLFKINTDTNTKQEVTLNGSFDITNIKLSPKEDFITFINKKDFILWSIDLK